MRYIFKFPDIGEGLDEGTIVEWYVQKGQRIRSGDPVVRMETDKVVTDIPSPKSGAVTALYGSPGETVHVGSPLIEIEIEGVFADDAISEVHSDTKTVPLEEGSAGVVGTLEVAGNNAYLPASEEGFGEKTESEKPVKNVLATPVARAFARELNIDIQQVTGTGPGGRVTKPDIQKFFDGFGQTAGVKQNETIGEVTFEPLTQIRKTIAKNMLMSVQNAVHMALHEEAEVSELIRTREKYKAVYAEQNVKLTYLAFIVKAVALALKKHPWLNAQMDVENSRMIFKHYYNIGIAVDTTEGLVVPVIRNADRLSLTEIAQQIAELSEKARTRKLTPEDMKNGTFTITNYGAIGGIFGLPIINYPQAGILGVGRMMKQPVVKDDQIVIGHILPLSLSVDHRIVDGGGATRFIRQVMDYLEDPVSMLME